MIFAVNLKTESGDSYLHLKEVRSEDEMLAELIHSMDEELAYVSRYEVESIGGDANLLSDLLDKHIELLEELTDV